MKYDTIRTSTKELLTKVAALTVVRRTWGRVQRIPRNAVVAGFFVVLLVASLGIYVGRAHAESQGPFSPVNGANVSGGGNTAWTNPANIASSNASYATATIASTQTSQMLEATNFGFSIPTGATINGVVVEVQKFATTASKNTMQDNLVSLLVGSTSPTGSNLKTAATWPTTSTYVSYGGSANTWGLSLTPAQVNASTFGAAIQAINVHSSGSSSSLTASVDHIRMTVYYAPPPMAYNQASYRLFNNLDGTSDFGNFPAHTDYPMDSSLKSVTSGDFDGDGYTDLATVGNSGDVSVLLNNGDGTFAAQTDYPVGSDPRSVTAADFNGDGKPDLVVTNYGDATVSVLLNNGDGTFAAQADYPTDNFPLAVTAADFNGDGKPDLVVATSNGVSVLLNNGDGTFAAQADYPVGSNPRSITAADFNGNGTIDIATANYGANTVSILNGNGDGTFATHTDYTTGGSPISISAADFNHDGHPDLVTADYADAAAAVLLNDGTGAFPTETDYPTGNFPTAVTVGDFDNDRWSDLAVTNEGDNTVSVLLNNDNGTFAAKKDFSIGSDAQSVTADDFDGDGNADLAVATESGAYMAVLLNVSDSVMDVGTPLAGANTGATTPGDGQAFRLRMDIGVSNADLSANAGSFKLRYAAQSGGSCSATPAGNYADITDTSTVQYYQNPNGANGGAIADSHSYGPTDGGNNVVLETYQGKGTTTFTNPVAIPAGQDGMWDFGLVAYQTFQNTTYCFKVVKSDNSDLNSYTQYPEITTPAATFGQSAVRWYNTVPQGGAATFLKAYGGANFEQATSMVKTSDGGYAVTGYTTSAGAGSFDAFLAKYDAAGGFSWAKTWGGTGTDAPRSIVQTSDGGYAVAGDTTSFGAGSNDIFLLKYDSSGNLSWAKTWGGSGLEQAFSVVQTSDGGYAVTGDTASYGAGGNDALLLKYDSSGNLSWSKTWGGSGNEVGNSVVQTSDGGYAVAGDTTSFGAGSNDIFLLKYDSSGNLSWSKIFGGASTDHAAALIQTSDGGYAITGYTESYGAGVDDMFLVKFDSSGNLSWSKTWGGASFDDGSSLVQTSDGGYAITGFTTSFGAGSDDMFLLKYDSSGNLSWNTTWGGSATDEGLSLVGSSDGGYMVTGYTSSYGTGTDMFLAKYDQSGDISGCPATMCKTPSATASSPNASLASPSATINSPVGISATPPATTGTVSFTTTAVVASPVPLGNPFAAENKPLDLPTRTPVTLRVALSVDGSGIDINTQSFKLQYAPLIGATSCSAVSGGSYTDVSGSGALHFYDDSRYGNGGAIATDLSDPSDGSRTMVAQTYQESNTFSNSQSALYAGQDGIWQFSLAIDSTTIKGRAFCLRVATSGGSQLTAANIAEVANSTQSFQRMKGGNWWNQEGQRQYINL